MSQDPAWTPPEQIEEFRILRPLGEGAMGRVYLGHDTLLERKVAVKFLSAAGSEGAFWERMLAEARLLARLSHPNVVTVYRIGQAAGRPYLVSELIEGDTLEHVDKPLPGAQVLDIGIRVARGLAAAHRHGVLHRDIKPANIMLGSDGEVKIIDFGVAEGETGLGASSEHYAGTPLYMAPEVLHGQPATPLSEIYAVGAVLYELCAGYAPRLLSHGGMADADLDADTQQGDAPLGGQKGDGHPPGESDRLLDRASNADRQPPP